MALSEYIVSCKNKRRESKRKALLMTHVVCGYPSFEANWQALEVMEAADVQLVELQFPFSEPSADGPLFVQANQKAIESGVSVSDCFAFMQKVSAHFSFKVLMMGYYNTVFAMGHQRFIQRLTEAGGVGFIVPDLPFEQGQELYALAKSQNISPIILMTPTHTDTRLCQLSEVAQGFVYAVARKGVTGASTQINKPVVEFIHRCQQHTRLPIAVGFGIQQYSDVALIGEHADIAIIGTAALQAWQQGGVSALRQFFAGINDE